jgi:hypothetical protein
MERLIELLLIALMVSFILFPLWIVSRLVALSDPDRD